MKYTGKSGYRKYRRATRKYRKGGKSTRKIAKRALRYVKGLQPEVKFSYLATIAQQFSWNPTTGYCTLPLRYISQDTTDSGRVGDRIKLIGHVMKCNVTNTLAGPFTYRLLCIQMLNNPNSNFDASTWLQAYFNSGDISTRTMVMAPPQYDKAKDFRVLYDKTFNLNQGYGTTAAPLTSSRYHSIHVKPNSDVQYYNSASAPCKNEFAWLFITNAVNNAGLYADVYFKTYYTDV